MIHLLATGGTIAMQRSASAGGNVPALDAAGLLALAGDLSAFGSIHAEDWERLPGVHRGPRELWAMRERVRALVTADARPDGVVITHGTDTLEETAYLLARTLPAEVPVVVTGAMRTSSDADWDGPSNLRDAFAVAAHAESRSRGAMVVFAGKIFDGHHVTKLNSFDPDAFGTPAVPILGRVRDGVVTYQAAPVARPTLTPRDLTPRVGIVPLILGDDGGLLDDALERFDGVVIEGFGRGNVPPGALPAIQRWIDRKKPVVLATRCPFGEVGGEYAFDGAGGQLLRMGVVAAGPRPTPLVRLELTLCLSAGVPYGAAS